MEGSVAPTVMVVEIFITESQSEALLSEKIRNRMFDEMQFAAISEFTGVGGNGWLNEAGGTNSSQWG
ncbi:MAG: hypothetical protein CMJ46_11760 [Planctomyces sp.]|nr:hypothetical protein [Planctomyces sp.]